MVAIARVPIPRHPKHVTPRHGDFFEASDSSMNPADGSGWGEMVADLPLARLKRTALVGSRRENGAGSVGSRGVGEAGGV